MSERAGAGTNSVEPFSSSCQRPKTSGFVFVSVARPPAKIRSNTKPEVLLHTPLLRDARRRRVRRDCKSHAKRLRARTLPAPDGHAPILKRREGGFRKASWTVQDLERADSHAAGRGPLREGDDHALARECSGYVIGTRSILDIEGAIDRDRLSGYGRREGFTKDDHSHGDRLCARRHGVAPAGGERDTEEKNEGSRDHQGQIIHGCQRMSPAGQES